MAGTEGGELADREAVFLIEPGELEPVLLLRRVDRCSATRPKHGERGVAVQREFADRGLQHAKLGEGATRQELHARLRSGMGHAD